MEASDSELAGTKKIFTIIDTTEQTFDHVLSEHITLRPQPTKSPNDPLNWSAWRRYWHAGLVLFFTGLTAATANDAGSAGDGQTTELPITWNSINIAAGILFVGIGYTCLLLSPATSLYGRRIVYLISMGFSLIGSVWFAKIQNSGDSYGSQFFVGASESCAESAAQLSLSDVFFEHQRGAVLGLYIFATSVGTFLGPLIASFIAGNESLGWRWIGWCAVIISAVTLVVFYFGLEETYFDRKSVFNGVGISQPQPDRITKNEKDFAEPKRGSDHGGEYPVVEQDRPKTYRERISLITPAPTLIGTGFKQYIQRLWHVLRIFYFPAVLYSGLQWGAQDAWLTFYLTIQQDNYYEEPWNYSDAAVGVMNVPTLIGASIGCIYGGWFSDYFVRWMAKRRGGISEAEDRLWLMLLPAVISPAGLMLFGIASDQGWTNWRPAYVGLGLIGFGWGCAGDLSMAYLQDAYPEMILEGMVGVAVIVSDDPLLVSYDLYYLSVLLHVMYADVVGAFEQNNTLGCIFTFATGMQSTNTSSLLILTN